MKKKIVISLIIVISLLIIIGSNLSFNKRLNDLLITKEQYDDIVNNKKYNYNLILDKIYFDDCLSFIDYSQNIYYSLIENSPTRYNPKVSYVSPENNLAIYGEQLSDYNIENNFHLKVLVFNNDYYNEYDLICTTLPLLSVNVLGEIGEDDVQGDIMLFDNRKESINRTMFSMAKIHIRGNASLNYDKKNYKLTLINDSVGNNIRENNISLLGLRKDADYILYSAYNDPEKIRNVFSSCLWNDLLEYDRKIKIKKGNEYKYVELFINGEYQGLYSIGYKIDKKLMNITNEDVMYKTISHYEINSDSYLYSVLQNDIEVVFSGKLVNDEWYPLSDYFYNIINFEETSSLNILKRIDVDNDIDFFLFINFVQGIDNYIGDIDAYYNCFFVAYGVEDDNYKMFIMPWDFDRTWGLDASDGEYPPSYPTVVKEGFTYKMCNIDSNYKKYVKDKYSEFRESIWSENNLMNIIDLYEKQIFGSGAFLRDLEKWPDNDSYSHHIDFDARLYNFRRIVLERIEATDEYINRF